MSEPVPVGVIGAGRIGRLHAKNLRQIRGARLAAIADPRLAAAEQAAVGNGARATEDWRELLQEDVIRAVVVCSPTDTHATIIEGAAAAGKHIFCEKPIDLDVDRAREALRAAERSGVRIQVGFNRRFDPSLGRVAELVRRGEIGTPELVRISSRDPHPPPIDYLKSSGGLFLDMSIHDLDMARHLVGDEVREIFATGSNLVDREIGRAGDIDTATITLQFRNGALGVIDNSRRAVYGYDQRVEVFGSNGCLTVGNPTPTSVSLWNENGRSSDRLMDFFVDRYAESFVIEMEAFIDCIRVGREPTATGLDAVRAIELALAAQRSLQERRPVRLVMERPRERLGP
jgi:myo-inositol 2-dehydrogenase/D-chiro-inositol 1-dehydrogenase